MKRRCLCPCHEGSIADRHRADGVDVADVIEAAVACGRCRDHHCAALSGKVARSSRVDGTAADDRPRDAYTYDNGECRPWAGEDGG